MAWLEWLLPAPMAAFTSLVVALVTIRSERRRDRRELDAKLEAELDQWKRSFAEAAAMGPMHTRLLAQQFRVGVLTVTHPDVEGTARHFIPRNVSLTIGTADTSNIVIDDPDGCVSRTHALIEAYEDGVFLIDISTNGTLLNGMPAGSSRQKLSTGDTLQLGAVSIAFRELPHEPPSPAF